MEVADHEAIRHGENPTGDFINQWEDAADWWTGSGKYDGSDLENASFFDTVSNWFTGNLDYRRELYLQKQAQDFNAAQARLDYERTKELRSTAYQDAFDDIEKAGLNPTLMYALGSGGSAATPGLSGARSGSGSHRKSAVDLKDILLFIASIVGSAGRVAAAADSAATRAQSFDFATVSRAQSAADRLNFDKEKYYDWLSRRR